MFSKVRSCIHKGLEMAVHLAFNRIYGWPSTLNTYFFLYIHLDGHFWCSRGCFGTPGTLATSISSSHKLLYCLLKWKININGNILKWLLFGSYLRIAVKQSFGGANLIDLTTCFQYRTFFNNCKSHRALHCSMICSKIYSIWWRFQVYLKLLVSVCSISSFTA